MNDFTALFIGIVSLFFLLVYIFWLYKDYRVDKFRQDIFSLRDDLFLDAAKDKINFDHPSYRMLRNTMNGSIRFAHKLSIVQVIMFLALSPKNEKLFKPYSERLHDSIIDLDEEQKALVIEYHNNMNMLMVNHMILMSPLFLMTVVLPIGLLVQTKKHISSPIKKSKSTFDMLDDEALLIGSN